LGNTESADASAAAVSAASLKMLKTFTNGVAQLVALAAAMVQLSKSESSLSIWYYMAVSTDTNALGRLGGDGKCFPP